MFIGNQDFLLKPERKVPTAQFIIAPAVFPKVAISAKIQILVSPFSTVAINTASDVAGIKVAERSAEKKNGAGFKDNIQNYSPTTQDKFTSAEYMKLKNILLERLD